MSKKKGSRMVGQMDRKTMKVEERDLKEKGKERIKDK